MNLRSRRDSYHRTRLALPITSQTLLLHKSCGAEHSNVSLHYHKRGFYASLVFFTLRDRKRPLFPWVEAQGTLNSVVVLVAFLLLLLLLPVPGSSYLSMGFISESAMSVSKRALLGFFLFRRKTHSGAPSLLSLHGSSSLCCTPI